MMTYNSNDFAPHALHKTNRFGKKFKIVSKKNIESLLQTEVLIKNYPFIVKIQETVFSSTTTSSLDWLIIVSKRRFRLAVHRNYIRRRIREGIRQNQQALYNHLFVTDRVYSIALQYVGSFDASSEWIQQKTQQTLALILQKATKDMGVE